MPIGKDETLTESAGRIADGREQDWDEAFGDAPELAHERAALERVAKIAAAWRAVGVTPDDDEADTHAFRWGELEAREKLGEGSFGEVWRAYDPALQREVALKLRRASGDDARDDSARRELDEARRLARVRHANVLQILGVAVHEGRAGLWTELVHGATLEQHLAAHGTLGAQEAALIGVDLCRALAAVHAAGLVHGDIKASNVMREQGGRIVLMDFGSVSEAERGGGVRTTTPLAAAPETLGGATPSVASDVYALGALLHRLVTGRHPLAATTLDELRERHARGERASLRSARPDLPSAFVAAIERALEPEPAARFADAGAFERALVQALPTPALVAAAPEAQGDDNAHDDDDSRAFMSGRVWPLAIALVVLSIAGWWIVRRPLELERDADPAPVHAPGVVAQRTPEPASAGAPATAIPVAPRAEAVLWRERDGDAIPLTDGAVIAPGDHLYLEYRGDEPLNVYVLDEDEKGATFTLFPVAGTDLSNPLRAGAKLRLPGRREGTAFDWVATSAGGREHVLVVASRTPLPMLDKLVAATPAAAAERPVAYARVDDGAMLALRGIGGLAPAPAGGAHASRLAEIARALAARQTGDLWARIVTLENP